MKLLELLMLFDLLKIFELLKLLELLKIPSTIWAIRNINTLELLELFTIKFLMFLSLVRMKEQGIINHMYRNAMYNATYCEGIDLTSDELRPLTLYDFGGVFFLFAAGEWD